MGSEKLLSFSENIDLLASELFLKSWSRTAEVWYWGAGPASGNIYYIEFNMLEVFESWFYCWFVLFDLSDFCDF